MATLYRKEGSPYYWIRFQYKGKRYRESTNTANEKKAKTILNQRVNEIKGSGSYNDLFERLLTSISKLPPKHQDKIRKDLSIKLMEGSSEKLLLKDAWNAWLKNPKKRNPSEVTLQGYKTHWNRFLNWIEKEPVKYLHEITPKLTEEYAADLWHSGIAPRTYNGHTKTLALIFNTLKVQAGLLKNVWVEIPSLEKDTKSKRMFTPDELTKICSASAGKMRYWIAIGLYTGLRMGDVVTMKWSEIDFDQRIIEKAPLKTIRKGKKVRFPLHPVLMGMLKQLKTESNSSNEYLFPEDAELYFQNRSEISKRIQKFFRNVGIKTTRKSNDGHRQRTVCEVGFHSLRHSFVSLCAANNVPQVAIMDLVGHGSPAMTEIYMHIGNEAKGKAIAALPDYEFGE
ncbi:MAG: tyrosine-type recombinase/integrase [Candidatus Theseobacter exili]|nr:tyrosine-type recombinase/integrase [Candidatus Theseobacter exili]